MTNSSRNQQHCCCSNSTIATHRAAVAAAAALCIHVKLTSRLLRRHLNHHRTYFCVFTMLQKKWKWNTKKGHHPRFEAWTLRSQGQQSTCYPNLFTVYIDRDWYVSIRTNRRLSYFDQKTKTAPVAGRRREHGRGRSRQSRERRERWGTSSKHHTGWWTSSRARAFTAQNLVSIWLLDCWDIANIYTYTFIPVVSYELLLLYPGHASLANTR